MLLKTWASLEEDVITLKSGKGGQSFVVFSLQVLVIFHMLITEAECHVFCRGFNSAIGLLPWQVPLELLRHCSRTQVVWGENCTTW